MDAYTQARGSKALDETLDAAKAMTLDIEKTRTSPSAMTALTETSAFSDPPRHTREFIALYDLANPSDEFAAIAMRGYEGFVIEETDDELENLTMIKTSDNVSMVPLTRDEAETIRTATTEPRTQDAIDGAKYAQEGDYRTAKATFESVYRREMAKVPPQAHTSFTLYDESPHTHRHDLAEMIRPHTAESLVTAKRAIMEYERERESIESVRDLVEKHQRTRRIPEEIAEEGHEDSLSY